MITKNDLYLLLSELEDKGINTEQQMNTLIRQSEVPIDVIQFINSNRQLDLTGFYEKIRKSYNNKKSSLYKNIVRSDETDDPKEVLTTLSQLLTQILLYSKNVEDRKMFLRHQRQEEISKVLCNYFQRYDLQNCVNLLRVIKADLKILEMISKKS